MASVTKFTSGAVTNQLRHNTRETKNPSNKDIDRSRTKDNYFMCEYDTYKKARDAYKKRINELYCYNRSDVITMASWVITCPKEITDQNMQHDFFCNTYNFLCERYGEDNVIQAVVHYDEGVKELERDRWTNEPILDAEGNTITKITYGQPHLHFCFIPVVEDPKHQQKEKVCAKQVLTKAELQHFHPDLQAYLDAHEINANVYTGITRANGGNRSVKELKSSQKERIKNKERMINQYEGSDTI